MTIWTSSGSSSAFGDEESSPFGGSKAIALRVRASLNAVVLWSISADGAVDSFCLRTSSCSNRTGTPSCSSNRTGKGGLRHPPRPGEGVHHARSWSGQRPKSRCVQAFREDHSLKSGHSSCFAERFGSRANALSLNASSCPNRTGKGGTGASSGTAWSSLPEKVFRILTAIILWSDSGTRIRYP